MSYLRNKKVFISKGSLQFIYLKLGRVRCYLNERRSQFFEIFVRNWIEFYENRFFIEDINLDNIKADSNLMFSNKGKYLNIMVFKNFTRINA